MSIKIPFEVNDAELRDEFLSRKVPEAIASHPKPVLRSLARRLCPGCKVEAPLPND